MISACSLPVQVLVSIISTIGIISVISSCCCQLAGAQLTVDEQKLALDFHNDLRSSVYPVAANMRMLEWSDSLAALAQKAADSCVFEHNYDGAYSGLGENLYMGGGDVKSAIVMWYTEGENYNFNSGGSCTPGRYPKYSTCGHWSQVVQAGISTVGCGLKSCSGSNLVVCEYNKGEGQPPYTTGAACSQCPYFAFYCYRGMCLTNSQRTALADPTAATCQPTCNECQYINYMEGFLCQCSNNASCTPSVCSAAGTPCVHGRDASSAGGSCACDCTAGYSGPQCQYSNNQLDNGIQLRFAGGVRSCSYYPTPTYAWWGALQAAVTGAVADILNGYCRGRNSTSAGGLCCPDTDGGVDSAVQFVNASDIQLADGGYPQQQPTGEATVVLYVLRVATDGFCNRTSASNPSQYLNLTAFEHIIREGNATTMAGRNSSTPIGCCGRYPTVITAPRNSTVHWPSYCLGSGGSGGGGSGSGSSGGSSNSDSGGLSGASLAGAIAGGVIGAVALVALILVIVLVIVPKIRSPSGADNLIGSKSTSPTPTSGTTSDEAPGSRPASVTSLRHSGNSHRVHPWPPQPPSAFVDADGTGPAVFTAPGPLSGMPFMPDSGCEPPPSFLWRV